MKSISNLSHAKAVHAVKSIGKVLLPVALLLAAILCIGVAAGAADKTYTHVPNTDLHVESDGTTSDLKPCEFKGAACATVWKCVCGNTKAHTPDESKHVKSYKVSVEYLKGTAGKCYNVSTFYTSCVNCGKVLTDTFVPKDVTIVKNEGHKFDQEIKDAKYLISDHECNTLVTYYKSCACGVSSKGITDETFADSTAVWPHNPVHYNGETDADFKAKGWTLKVEDLKAKVNACNGNGTYFDYCKDCGAVIKDSTSEYTGGTGHTWVVYKNENVHWKACKYCGEVDGIFEGHVYDANAKATCQASVNCTVCGYAVIGKADHKFEDRVAEKAATCNTDGNVAYRKCSVCGKLFDDNNKEIKAGEEVTKALGHLKAEDAPLCNPGKCTRVGCGQDIVPLTGHTYAKSEANYIKVNGKLTDKLLCTAVCSECKQVLDAKGHTYVEKVVKEATCKEDGSSIKICTKCGDIAETKTIKALGHNLGDQVVNCYQSAKCTVCGTVVSGEHTMPETLKNAIKNGTLRCTDSYKCTVCGIELVGNTQHKIENVAAVAATCTADGNTAGWKCTDKVVINGIEYACNMHYGVDKVNKTGHKYGDWKVTVEATCMNAGKKTRTCSVCGATEDATIAKTTTHKLSENYMFSSEKHWKYCTVPGCTYIDALEDHKIGEPTCTEDAVCEVCGYTVKATGHVETEWKYDETNHWKACKKCGVEISGTKVAHSYTHKDRVEPDRCKDGYTEHEACACGKTVGKTTLPGDKTAHVWGAWKYASKNNSNTNATGNAKNSFHNRQCTVCKAWESHASKVDAKTQTCLTDGTCQNCDLVVLDKNGKVSKPATDHKFGQLATRDNHTYTAECTACGLKVTTIKHTIEGPACTDRKCSFEGCDYVVKASADHIPDDAVEPVKNASGHSFTCKTCHQKIANELHKADAVVDCTENLVCKVCGWVMAEGNKNHDWVLVPGTPATCTAEGTSDHFKCKNCTVETTYDVIAKTEHTWVEKEGKPATTTETGHTAYKECSVCGEKVGYQEIPKLAVVRGDFNNDGKVNKDDAIYLLKSVLLGTTDYPINQSADVDGNGKANKDDAIYLLKNVLLGDALYPLK